MYTYEDDDELFHPPILPILGAEFAGLCQDEGIGSFDGLPPSVFPEPPFPSDIALKVNVKKRAKFRAMVNVVFVHLTRLG